MPTQIITDNMSTAEAAQLLARLDDGQRAAWQSTREVLWQSAEYESRLATAAEVDAVFRDVQWDTAENGMRRTGEGVAEFADRTGAEARLDGAREAGHNDAHDQIIAQADAGMEPDRILAVQDEIATRLLSDATTPEGQAYAAMFSDTAATYVREMRERDPRPEPDLAPGTPHPDPFLAARGWHAGRSGIYERGARLAPEQELEAEAG